MLIRVMLCFLGKVEGVSRGIAVRSFVFGRSYSSTIFVSIGTTDLYIFASRNQALWTILREVLLH